MRKKLLSLFLAMGMALSLAAPAFAALSPLRRHTMLEHLPTTLQRPARPATLEQIRDFDHSDTENKESLFREFLTFTDSLTAGKANDREKMKAIYDWVSQNIMYDKGTDSGALELWATTRRTNCVGYSDLCRLMGTVAGIPVATIGSSSNEVNYGFHTWNAALIDGEWLYFDATWKKWDMAPDYHTVSDVFDCYDGVFTLRILDNHTDDGSVEMILSPRPGFRCPDELVIPSYGVTDIEAGLGDWTHIKSVTIPNTVTTVNAFSNCTDLESVILPDGVTSVSGFYDCTGLKSISIPDSVTSISGFGGCASLKSISIPDGVTTIENNTFIDCTSLERVTFGKGLTGIEYNAFYGCTALKSVTIPDGVTAIGDMAFYGCTSLTDVTLPNSVTSLGNDVFGGCPNLKRTDIPTGMTTIAAGSFQDRTDLTSFVIPDHITEIGNWAFRNCTNLQSVTIPDSVTIIGNSAFWGCTSLTGITIPNSVTTIEYGAFADCTGMTSMIIPEGVTSIGYAATPYTLTYITIPTSVTSIGGSVLSGCLKDVYYAGTEEQWRAISIEEPNLLDRVTVHYNSAGPRQPAQPEQAIAYASTQNVLVDGKSVEFYAYALKDANGNDTNYVKLRDVAQVLSGSAAQFEVGWDGAVNMETGRAYTSNGSEMVQNFTGNQPYTVNTSPVKVNGVEADLEAIVLKDAAGGAYTYFKLRDLGAALGFNVGYAGGTGIFIQTDRAYTDAD